MKSSPLKRSRPQTTTRLSSLIGSEGLLNFLLSVCQRVEEEEVAEQGKTSESDSEIAENEAFIGVITSLDDSLLERDDTDIENDKANDWEDKSENEPTSEAWIRSGASLYIKSKLIQILEGNVLIPKQRGSLCKILATLVYHRNDEKLCSYFCQFRSFAYQTMMTESTKDSRWPHVLMQKDLNLMIRFWFRAEIEKRNDQEVQKLYQTSSSGMACSKGDVD